MAAGRGTRGGLNETASDPGARFVGLRFLSIGVEQELGERPPIDAQTVRGKTARQSRQQLHQQRSIGLKELAQSAFAVLDAGQRFSRWAATESATRQCEAMHDHRPAPVLIRVPRVHAGVMQHLFGGEEALPTVRDRIEAA